MLDQIGSCFNLHPLVVEDILHTEQRPKIEDHGTYIQIVLKMILPQDASGRISTEQVSLVFGKNFLLSYQEHNDKDVFDDVRSRIRNKQGIIRNKAPDFLCYALIDAIVNNYFIVLEKLGTQIDILEEEIVQQPKQKTLRQLYTLKRELIYIRNAIWPLREVVNSLHRSESILVSKSSAIYFKDVYDHIVEAIDTIEIYREMASGMLEIYLSSTSNRLNEVMKVLTIIATIFIPLTFITGVYGMNFRFMPELNWKFGYLFTLFLMAAVAFIMIDYFKRKGWF